MPYGETTSVEIERVATDVVDSCYVVHRHWGPGLLESAYEACLCRELALRGIAYEKQVPLPVSYKGLELDYSYRIDVLVEGLIVVELKAVEKILPLHTSQILTYLKLGGYHSGLLINFNVPVLLRGVHRRINSRALTTKAISTPVPSASSA